MVQPKLSKCLAASSALLALAVSGQAPPEAVPDPTAQSQTAPAPYRSALQGYQPYSDINVMPWREANDTVGKIGGWRAYAKEAAEGQGSEAKPPADGGAADPHAGHGKPRETRK
jgi:hypothetical protein